MADEDLENDGIDSFREITESNYKQRNMQIAGDQLVKKIRDKKLVFIGSYLMFILLHEISIFLHCINYLALYFIFI